jgi:hypothetical protein
MAMAAANAVFLPNLEAQSRLRPVFVLPEYHTSAADAEFPHHIELKTLMSIDICAAHNNFVIGQVFLSMPSLGVSSLDFDRVVKAMRSFFRAIPGKAGNGFPSGIALNRRARVNAGRRHSAASGRSTK